MRVAESLCAKPMKTRAEIRREFIRATGIDVAREVLRVTGLQGYSVPGSHQSNRSCYKSYKTHQNSPWESYRRVTICENYETKGCAPPKIFMKSYETHCELRES